MTDLISRETTLQAFDNVPVINNLGLEPVIAVRDVKELIKEVPFVKAFPIKELCKALAENCDCPTGYSPAQDCDRNCEKCWESAIKEWMNEDNGN